MDYGLFIELGGLTIVILSNLVLASFFFARLGIRIKHCEGEIEQLKLVDSILVDEIKTLHKIEGQLELLISHFMKKK